MRAAIGLIFLLATSALQAQSRPYREYDLSKPVRAIRAEVERTVGGVQGPRLPRQTVTFDEQGNVLTAIVYKPDGSLLRKLSWAHEYDKAGREIKTYYYNDKGVLTNTGVHVYDLKDRRTQTTQINPNGSINHLRSYSYDDQGNIIRESHRNENGSPRLLINRKYDTAGRATEEVYINAKGALHHRNVMTYDQRGNQTGWTLFKQDGTAVQPFRNTFSYDERGNIKEVITHSAGGVLKSKESFSYEFDDVGNWIKRVATREIFKENGSRIETEVTYRQLTYF